MMKLFRVLSIITLLLLGSCMQAGTSARKFSQTEDTITGGEDGDRAPASETDGDGARSGNGNINDGNNNTDEFTNGKAELRHFIDPFDGTFKTKLTLPKNFTGLLHLSGLNITSLNESHVVVRFNFGREYEPIEVPATVGRVKEGGMTPKTDIEVLILNFPDKPFENVRLLYDLYDYNDYRDDNSVENKEPVSDPRDKNLYCRGLKLEHDPTFLGSSNNAKCDEAGEKCLYAYAKLFDSGLVDEDGIMVNPTQPQQDVAGAGYNNEATGEVLKKCLPDNNSISHFEGLMRTSVLGGVGLNTTGISRVSIDNKTYIYNGPFAPNDYANWEITGEAVVAPTSTTSSGTGLFQFSYENFNAGDPEQYADGGFRSHLFPRAMKRNLTTGVEYFGNSGDDPFGIKGLLSMQTNTESEYMNGCSSRVVSRDDYTNESISSCNVTATIEIITKAADGTETVVDTRNELKLQLIRPSLTDFRGQEVLYSSLNTCENSSMCGVNECCFNQRCWSKDIVNQCIEDITGTGNLGIGESCGSDYQCNSLCCRNGICSVHTSTEDEEPVLCSKSPGQTCAAKEWCRQDNIQECKIIATGTDTQGNVTCALRCYNVPTFGECRNGICIPPTPPAVPIFDPANPDCSQAEAPPTF
jgi:hypothetical protein